MELIRFSEKNIKEKIKDLKTRISVLDRNIKEAIDLVQSANKELDKEHPHLIKKMKELDFKVRDLQAKAKMKNKLDEKSPEMRDPSDNFLKPPKYGDDGNLKTECKKMFRKISKLCHPDTCEDEELHLYFIEAKEAMESLDYSALERIHYNITAEETFQERTLKELRAEIEALLKIWQEKLKYYSFQKSQPGYVIAKGFYSKDDGDNIQAYQNYTFLVYERMKSLNEMIKKLKNKIG